MMAPAAAAGATMPGRNVRAVVLDLGAKPSRSWSAPSARPAWLEALIDVRGKAMPMVDLRIRLGRSVTRVLVVEVPVADASEGDRFLTPRRIPASDVAPSR